MKLCVLLVGVALAAGLGGCRSGDMMSLSETQGEHDAKLARNVNETVRQIPQDVDMLLLLDKPVRLSEMPVPSH